MCVRFFLLLLTPSLPPSLALLKMTEIGDSKDPNNDYFIGISINEDKSIFSVGTLTGFKSFSTKTNRLLFSHGKWFFLSFSLFLSHVLYYILITLEFGTPIGIVELFPGIEIVGIVSSNGVQNGTRLNIWDNIQVNHLTLTKHISIHFTLPTETDTEHHELHHPDPRCEVDPAEDLRSTREPDHNLQLFRLQYVQPDIHLL